MKERQFAGDSHALAGAGVGQLFIDRFIAQFKRTGGETNEFTTQVPSSLADVSGTEEVWSVVPERQERLFGGDGS